MSFVKQFDPTNKEHVEWLQKIDVSMSKATQQEKYGSVDFMKIVNDNPFGIKMTNPMEWARYKFTNSSGAYKSRSISKKENS